MPPLKIAQVAATGLTLRVLLPDQILALTQAGHQVVGVCAPGPHADALRAQGLAIETVDIEREISPWRDLRALRQLRTLFRRESFDVVHTHTPKAGLLGPMAARMASVPIVVHTIHGLMFHDAMPRWRRAAFWLPEKITAMCSHRLLSQSREDMDVAVRAHLCSPEKLVYLGNGIDVSRFAPRNGERTQESNAAPFDAGDFVVGTVGRLVYEKGFADLFAAARQIIGHRRDIKFLIVGPRETDQKDVVSREEMASLEATGCVRFADWADDVAPWYAQMEAFVLPSYREGIPRACMEAAASGLPVIATNIRGCREVVLDGETGVLVPMKNSAALAHAIEAMAADRERAREMGLRGREHIVANFNREQVLARLLAFYETLSTSRSSARKP